MYSKLVAAIGESSRFLRIQFKYGIFIKGDTFCINFLSPCYLDRTSNQTQDDTLVIAIVLLCLPTFYKLAYKDEHSPETHLLEFSLGPVSMFHNHLWEHLPLRRPPNTQGRDQFPFPQSHCALQLVIIQFRCWVSDNLPPSISARTAQPTVYSGNSSPPLLSET